MSEKRLYIFVSASFLALLLPLVAVYVSVESPIVINWLAKWGIVLHCLGTSALLAALRWIGPSQTREFAANATLIAVALALCVGAAEAATRYIFRDISTTGTNSGFFSRQWWDRNPLQVNRWKFRERDFALTPADNVYRIAVIGDSITYGQGILESERMTNLLAARLNNLGRQYEVLNFARPGAETIDHLEFLRGAALRSEPDFVLLQWFVNDVEGHDKTRRPPWRGLAPSSILHEILWRHSAFYNVATISWNKILVQIGMTGRYETYVLDRFADPQSPDSLAASEALREFIELTRSHDVPMGIVLFPSLTSFQDGDYAFAFLHDRVLTVCAEYALPCLDLRDTISPGTDPYDFALSQLDAHPSALANQWMADGVLTTFAQVWGIDGRLEAAE